jgi:pectate lyase
MEISNAQHALATYVGPNSGTKSSNVPAQTNKESVNNVPTQTGLIGNYPNPCNPSTTIPYNLAASGHVTLAVYDVLGRKVKTLVNEIQAAGYHTVVFDASNLSSGLYFYRFTTIGMTQVKKLVVTK